MARHDMRRHVVSSHSRTSIPRTCAPSSSQRVLLSVQFSLVTTDGVILSASRSCHVIYLSAAPVILKNNSVSPNTKDTHS